MNVNDIGAGILLSGLVALLLAALVMHLYVRSRTCGLCGVALTTDAERRWGVCARHHDQLARAMRGDQ